MSDGGRGRVSIAIEMLKSFQDWSARRSAVRSIAGLGPSDILHKRGNIDELDDRTHTVQFGHSFQQLVREERFGGVL